MSQKKKIPAKWKSPLPHHFSQKVYFLLLGPGLGNILVSSKLRTDKQTDVTKGSFRCGKNCITCRYITDGRTNYTFSATGEIRNKNHSWSYRLQL